MIICGKANNSKQETNKYSMYKNPFVSRIKYNTQLDLYV